MVKKDNRVDTYIAKSQDFAKPILNHLRELIHKACPDVQETIKWGFPNFDYNGIMCNMAAFKQHAVFNFWKSSLMADPKKILSKTGETAMGNFGQLKSLSDLPNDKIILDYIKEAAALNEKGVKIQRKSKSLEKEKLVVPGYFITALKKNKKAQTTFENFSYTNKKEYVEWVTGAKTEETRNKRLKTSVEWMAEGKIRNWKYVKK
jgi:uncharacterized protein YdeI (YjbR/CyaY-like superfamily)